MTKATATALLCTACLVLSAPLALAQCSTGDQNVENNSGTVFGLRWDGTVIGEGQSFTLDCRAQFLTASFELNVVEGGSIGGQPYLLATDVIIMELMDMDFTVLATTSMPLGFGDGTQWIQFDITDQNVMLDAGDYIVGCRTEAPRIASLSFDGGDTHDGGRHVYWIDEWQASPTSTDVCFQATWDPDEVPTVETNWGSLKTSYR